MDVNRSEDVSLHPRPVPGEAVKGDKITFTGLLGKCRDACFCLCRLPFPPRGCGLLRVEIQPMFLNHPLDFPGRDGCAVCPRIEHCELFLAIPEMRPAEPEDAEFLKAGDLPLTGAMRSPAPVFERCQPEWLVPLFPAMEALAGDAEMAAGQGRVLRFPVEVHPGEPLFRLFGERGGAREPRSSLGEHK